MISSNTSKPATFTPTPTYSHSHSLSLSPSLSPSLSLTHSHSLTHSPSPSLSHSHSHSPSLTLPLILLLIPQLSFAHKVKSPKDVQSAVLYLKEHCTDSLFRLMVCETYDTKLVKLYDGWGQSCSVLSEWFKPGKRKSQLNKYLLNKGVADLQHQKSIVLIGFKRALLNQSFDEAETIKHYRKIEEKLRAEEQARFVTDTIQGVYIPKDLQDCFRQLDSMWADSIKMKVKAWSEDKFSIKTHFTTGWWMRNNWQLWGGSRLSKYFNELGIYHPDDMSGIILRSYHRYLNGKEIKLEEQIKYYRDYWKASKKRKRSKE